MQIIVSRLYFGSLNASAFVNLIYIIQRSFNCLFRSASGLREGLWTDRPRICLLLNANAIWRASATGDHCTGGRISEAANTRRHRALSAVVLLDRFQLCRSTLCASLSDVQAIEGFGGAKQLSAQLTLNCCHLHRNTGVIGASPFNVVKLRR